MKDTKIKLEHEENTIHERNFRILNKLDRAMMLNPNVLFCDLYKTIVGDKDKLKDLEFVLLIDKFIENSSKNK